MSHVCQLDVNLYDSNTVYGIYHSYDDFFHVF